MQARLIPLDGSQSLLLTQPIIVVGRNAEYCDIVISHEKISAVHCIIAQQGGLLFLRDMKSTNGTFVNDIAIIRSIVAPGDRIRIAEFTFVLQIDRGNQSLTIDQQRDIVTHVPRPTPLPVSPPAIGPLTPSQESSIQVFDSFIGKFKET